MFYSILPVLFALSTCIVFTLQPLQTAPRQNPQNSAITILKQHCIVCHGPNKQQGKLRLDQDSATLRKLLTKPSGLLERVTASDATVRMPPEGPALKSEEIAILRQWIEQGAPWPAQSSPHWAFVAPRRPAVSSGKHPVDALVQQQLDQLHITPAPAADPATLVRRLHLDLLGLLPKTEDVESYVRQPTPAAYEALVDKLLASPHFGERWARHWLDLARYGDSDGYEHDEPRKNAYLFRDWVIDAYNTDKPYDQFTIEQLAGDLLPNPTHEQYIASGFHRQTQKHNTAEMYKEEFRIKMVKDRVNTTGTTWLGLTVACAECHHHKYDPLTQQEYYQLYAFFNDAEETERANNTVASFRYQQRVSHLHQRGNHLTPGEEVQPATPAFLPVLQAKEKRATRLDLARWLVQKDHPLTARVEASRVWQHLFGQPLIPTPDDLGLHGTPPRQQPLLDWLACELQSNGWSRKKLIKTIVLSNTYRQSSSVRPELLSLDPQNTLFARQNRYRLEAEIVHDIAIQAGDLLKLEDIGGSPFQPVLPRGLETHVISNNKLLPESDWEDRFRRGIYIQVQRTFQHPLLKTLDAPDGNQCCPVRDRYLTAAQSLLLLNDSLYQEASGALGDRMQKRTGTLEEKLRWAFQLCLSRPPMPAELQVLSRLYEQMQKSYPAAPMKGVALVLLNMEAFSTRE
ncbi:MAG: PSD1 and planctomycete cytochrome C domain-containing protein [Gemmatales bacterium]